MFDEALTFVCSHFLVITLVMWAFQFLLVAFFTGSGGKEANASLGFVILISGVFAIGTVCGAIVALLMWEIVVTLLGAILLLQVLKWVMG